jgi:hypothetical protein
MSFKKFPMHRVAKPAPKAPRKTPHGKAEELPPIRTIAERNRIEFIATLLAGKEIAFLDGSPVTDCFTIWYPQTDPDYTYTECRALACHEAGHIATKCIIDPKDDALVCAENPPVGYWVKNVFEDRLSNDEVRARLPIIGDDLEALNERFTKERIDLLMASEKEVSQYKLLMLCFMFRCLRNYEPYLEPFQEFLNSSIDLRACWTFIEEGMKYVDTYRSYPACLAASKHMVEGLRKVIDLSKSVEVELADAVKEMTDKLEKDAEEAKVAAETGTEPPEPESAWDGGIPPEELLKLRVPGPAPPSEAPVPAPSFSKPSELFEKSDDESEDSDEEKDDESEIDDTLPSPEEEPDEDAYERMFADMVSKEEVRTTEAESVPAHSRLDTVEAPSVPGTEGESGMAADKLDEHAEDILDDARAEIDRGSGLKEMVDLMTEARVDLDHATDDAGRRMDEKKRAEEKETALTAVKTSLGDIKIQYFRSQEAIQKLTKITNPGQTYHATIQKHAGTIYSLKRALRKLFTERALRRGYDSGIPCARDLVRAITNPGKAHPFMQEERFRRSTVGILIDLSGSMGGEKIRIAREVSIILAEALRGADLNFGVFGFCAES